MRSLQYKNTPNFDRIVMSIGRRIKRGKMRGVGLQLLATLEINPQNEAEFEGQKKIFEAIPREFRHVFSVSALLPIIRPNAFKLKRPREIDAKEIAAFLYWTFGWGEALFWENVPL